ncbi:MAG: glycosyltransferase family 4 protein [Panacibacter sp.]
MDKHLHIICLDVPYPSDYGGVYDLFYKLPALQAQGVKIHLHCFDNGRGEQPELNKYCAEVHYYKRNTGHKGFSSTLPYIVSSRKNEALAQNLLKDDYPIFMEGVHCTYLTLDKRFSARRKFVRIHNVEHQYYHELFSCSQHAIKKMYYWWESRLLKTYETELVKNATAFWAVTPKDTDYYRNQLHCSTMDYLPLFLPGWHVKSLDGMGTFCLYHGNLEVAENEYAAEWLLKNIFNKLEIPLVIAGKNPSAALEKMVHNNIHTCLVANPSEKELQDMIAKAQIHILPSFNNTGIKIKLLNALYNGRHCLVNTQMVEGTGLAELCITADDVSTFCARVEQLYHQPFTQGDIEARKKLLHNHYNNEAGAKQMVKWIWETYS